MQRCINFRGRELHYTSTDERKKSVILLHGFLEDITMWERVIKSFQKDYQLICIDLPGHGKSENLCEEVYTIPLMSEIVYKILTELQIKKTILVGHSMGGYVAADFADKYPEKILGLCLLNSTCRADSKVKKQVRLRAIQAVKKDYKAFINNAIPMLFSDKNKVSLKKEVQKVIKIALHTDKQAVIKILEGMRIREDKTDIWKNKHFYKMLIFGENDALFTLEQIHKEIENTDVNLVQLSGGHMSLIENKQKTLKSLQLFFEKSYIFASL